ncbi:MAG: hypothetical protein M1816_002036 [Peltula sp. TS41687]|nr:MAG: hypothetical protein M1816_002036 [Peltula sp. TS41687]
MSDSGEYKISARKEFVKEIPGEADRNFTTDEETLVALGYKPELKRDFNLWTAFCVSWAILGLLPSFASTLYYSMGYAGTPGMVWGWLIAMLFISCVALNLAEICSSMPTSGGAYYASAVLAPRPFGPLAAWITGWSNWLALVCCAPSVNYALAAMILAAASIENPTYTPENYQVFLLTALLQLLQACISGLPTKWIAQFNSAVSSFNIIGLIVVIIMIPAGTNREAQGYPKFTSSGEVWGNFYEGTSFPNGIAILMSFVGAMWIMAGFDAPLHVSEEVSNASITAPRAIVLTVAVGGIFGWFLQLVVAYTVIDIPSVIFSPLGQPFAAYLFQIMPRKTAMVILALTIFCAFCCGQGCMVTASRLTFAYSRDGCLPGSRFWRRVNKHTQTPVNAVWFNSAIGLCLICLIFTGPLAISAIFSIGAVANYVAFSIPIFIRTFLVRNRFRRGPWHLGRFGIPIGVVSCAYVAVMVPILCLPSLTGSALEAKTMNWTAVVYGGPMLFALVWWVLSAHKWFKGPKVNVEHRME